MSVKDTLLAVSGLLGGNGSGGGGDISVVPLTATENKKYTAPAGKAYSPVTVNVPGPSGTKQIVISANGITTENVGDYANAEISVSVPTPTPTLVPKTVTENGTYDAEDDNADGYSSVTVNVAASGGGAQLIASGTFEGNGDYKFEIPVGKKMPQTDFVFILWVNNGTEFVRSNNLQFMTVVATVLRRFASYDLSTDGTKEALRPFWVYDNNEGTVTKKDFLMVYGCEQTIRTGLVQGPGMMGPQFGTKVKRSTSGFSFIMSKAASDYQFVSGMTYNWELLYIGSDPTNDIVEVP